MGMMQDIMDAADGTYTQKRETAAYQDAYSKMQGQIGRNALERREKHKQAVAGTMIPMQKPTFKEQTPLERWREEVDLMNTSGNADLQQMGRNQVSQWHQRNTTPGIAGKDARTMGAKYADELNLVGKERDDYIRKYANQKNFADPNMTAYGLSDADKLEFKGPDGVWRKAPPGVTPQDVQNAGRDNVRMANLKDKGTAGTLAMLDTAYQEMDTIKDLIYNPETGAVNRKIMELAWGISNDPTGGYAAKKAGEWSGRYTVQDGVDAQRVATALEMGIQAITRTETGAAMPPEEVRNTRTRFHPSPSDPDIVVKQKLAAYQYFIEHAMDMIDPAVRKGNDAAALTREVKKAADKAFEMVGKQSRVDARDKPSVPKIDPFAEDDSYTPAERF